MIRLCIFILLTVGHVAQLAAQQTQQIASADLVEQVPLEDAAWSITTSGFFGTHWVATDPGLQEVLRRLERRELTAADIRRFFDRLFEAQPVMAEQIVLTHPHWPEGRPIRCRLVAPSVLFRPRRSSDVTIRARLLHVEDAPIVECVDAIWHGSLTDDEIEPALCTSGLPPGRYDIEVEVYVGVDVSRDEADRHSYHVDRSAQVLAWKGIARTIEVGGAAADLLEPFDSEQAERSIKQSLNPQFYIDDRSRPWLVMFRNCCHIGHGDEDWSLAGIAEVCREGDVIATGTFVYPMVPPDVSVQFSSFYKVFPLAWVNGIPDGFDAAPADWQIRLSGDADTALRDLQRESYWAGTLTLPTTLPEHIEYVSQEIRAWDRLEERD